MSPAAKPDNEEAEDDALLFLCDEAACRQDRRFYEVFSMEARWDIIRAVIQAASSIAAGK